MSFTGFPAVFKNNDDKSCYFFIDDLNYYRIYFNLNSTSYLTGKHGLESLTYSPLLGYKNTLNNGLSVFEMFAGKKIYETISINDFLEELKKLQIEILNNIEKIESSDISSCIIRKDSANSNLEPKYYLDCNEKSFQINFGNQDVFNDDKLTEFSESISFNLSSKQSELQKKYREEKFIQIDTNTFKTKVNEYFNKVQSNLTKKSFYWPYH